MTLVMGAGVLSLAKAGDRIIGSRPIKRSVLRHFPIVAEFCIWKEMSSALR